MDTYHLSKMPHTIVVISLLVMCFVLFGQPFGPAVQPPHLEPSGTRPPKPALEPPDSDAHEPAESDDILWWRLRIPNAVTIANADCEGCDPNLPEAFLHDSELARLARVAAEEDELLAQLICGTIQGASRFPDCVAFRRGTKGNYATIGSGVLISSNEVLTARHVAQQLHDDRTIRVVVDDYAWSEVAERTFELASPPYRSHASLDLAVVTLDRKVPAELAKPRPIGNAGSLCKGERVILAGYGLNNVSHIKHRRQVVRVFVATPGCNETCNCADAAEFETTAELAWCDSCSHDSGGPVYAGRGDDWHVIGVIKKPVGGCDRHGGCGCGSVHTYADKSKDL